MNEIWRDIPNFEGCYQASTEGRIKSLSRITIGENRYTIREHILKGNISVAGYVIVHLSKDGTHKYKKVHKLVALTFPEICGKPFPGAEVMHLDDCKTNNKATNLRWGTRKENANWNDLPKRIHQKLINHPAMSIPICQYTKDGELVRIWLSNHDIQRELGYDRKSIKWACIGKQNTAYGYVWKYKNPTC